MSAAWHRLRRRQRTPSRVSLKRQASKQSASESRASRGRADAAWRRSAALAASADPAKHRRGAVVLVRLLARVRVRRARASVSVALLCHLSRAYLRRSALQRWMTGP